MITLAHFIVGAILSFTVGISLYPVIFKGKRNEK